VAAAFLVGPQPPIASLEKARSALSKAGKAPVLRYAKDPYHLAEETMREGWMEMSRQNGRLRLFRDYQLADSLLNFASQMADQAAQQANRRICYLDSCTRSEYADVENELLLWREALNGSLVKLKGESYLSLVNLSLQISQMLINIEEYEEASLKLAEGREALVRLSEMLAQYSDDEAQNINVWRRWIEETLTESSKKNTFAVIVDKSAHRTYLVNAGKLVHTYDCDLGYNSAHHKLFAGDGATPEGRYKITAVKSRGSKYYKALLLNYPNPSDKKRFEENKRKGIISPHARIGGFIEIHGEGGKNKDWTEGCVALTNGDMDHLMQYVRVGTPVTLVRRSDQWP
jgi:L,D-peptidoglycan transpeptidase YkuD (ErfK/YbiS/YcfS/YnhG family)